MTDFDWTAGMESECEDCKSRYMTADECGVSYECSDEDTCEVKKEARLEHERTTTV